MTIPLPVLIDGRIFSLQSKGGISQLWASVLSSPSWRREIQTVLFLYPGYEKNIHLAESRLILGGADRVRVIHSPIPPSDNKKWCGAAHDTIRHEQLARTRVVPKIVFNTYYGENVFPSCSRYVVVAHDFAHEELNELSAKPSTLGVLQQKDRAFQQASDVICISSESRQRFFAHYGWYNRQHVTVIYHGHDQFQPTMGRVRNLILHVGTRGGYKNFDTVRRGVGQLMTTRSAVRFFILGGEPPDDKIRAFQENFPGRVRVDTGVTDQDMDCAMAIAGIYVSASRYEGFGIPLLNALHMGVTPVVSDIPVYREIAGRHAYFFRPESAESLTATLDHAIQSRSPRPQFLRTWDDVACDYIKLAVNL